MVEVRYLLQDFKYFFRKIKFTRAKKLFSLNKYFLFYYFQEYSKPEKVEVIDVKVQVMECYPIYNQQEITLNLKHLPNSLYLCRVVTNNGEQLYAEKLTLLR